MVIILLSTSCSSDLIPKVLANDTQGLVEQVKHSNEDVFKDIQDNINMVVDLQTKVEQAKIDGEEVSLKDVIKDIKKITESYEDLSSRRANVESYFLRKIKHVEQIRGTVENEIAILNKRKATYIDQMNTLSSPSSEINRTRRKSLTKAVEYVDDQIALWVQFNGVESDITKEMSNIQERIDLFLSVIESSAILFREGLNLLELQQNINEALAIFTTDIPRMEQLTQQMENSWDNLDYLVNALTSIDPVTEAVN
jgi:hypothetical protein